jgi:uncharacterized tellurite resistance protein B-like protein
MSDLDSLIQPPRFVASEVDLDAAAALTIAAAMREVALCDGEHPREVQLIDTFESQVPGSSSGVDLSTLTTEEHREVFLKSIVLVAFADGQVSPEERRIVERYADALELDADARARAWTEVASALLSVFSGIQNYRSQVVSLGESMGLDRSTIDHILG